MKSLKVLLLLAGLNVSLTASDAGKIGSFAKKDYMITSEMISSMYSKLTSCAQQALDKTSELSSSALTVGNDYVINPLLQVGPAISNEASKVGWYISNSSVAKNVSDLTSTVSATASKISSDAAAYLSTSASTSYDSSAKFCKENPKVVGAVLFTATVATFLAYMKYQKNGYVFYASKTSEKEAAK